MWLELIKKVDDHQVGKFIEVEDAIGRNYIDAGFAKDGGDGPDVVILQRSIEKVGEKLNGFVTAMADRIEQSATQLNKRPVIRSGEFSHLENGESEADKQKSIGDFIQRQYNAGGFHREYQGDTDFQRANLEHLQKVYASKRTTFDRGPKGEIERASMTEGQGSSLGYTTPVIYESMIMAEAAEEETFLTRARKIPMGARQVEYPALDQYRIPAAGQSAMYGGVQVFRKGETVQRTQTQAFDKKITLVANDLTAFFALSRDLLEDSTATLDAMIPQLGGQAIGWRCDWECLNGSLSGQLMGIMNAPCLIKITRNTSAHIKYQDVFSMYTRLLPRAKRGAAWYVHPFAMNDVMALADTSGRFINMPTLTSPPGGPISGSPSPTLMGLPIIESEKLQPLGTSGDIVLAAMDRYLYGTRSGLETGISDQFYFDTDQIAIRLKIRNDGKPQLVNSIYLADGSQSNKVSAFITLTT